MRGDGLMVLQSKLGYLLSEPIQQVSPQHFTTNAFLCCCHETDY